MTTPPSSEPTPARRFDPAGTHQHSPRCFWDLYHAGWRCPPPQREDTDTSSTRTGAE